MTLDRKRRPTSSVATGLNRQAAMRRVALTHVAVTQEAGS